MAAQKLRVLVLCDFQGWDANVVRDYLYCFNRFSRHEFYYLHYWRRNQCQRLRNLDLNAFDVILFFWDCGWINVDVAASPFYVPSMIIERIANSRALKVQFLQDEYRDVRRINRMMAGFGINLMFTCVAEEQQDVFYPRSLIPSLEATYSVLTGYVPDYLEHIHFPAHEPRPIDIGYRSRTVPFYLGSLAQEKVQIAHEFTRIGRQHGFSTDISVREQDRIYGQAWLEFLKSSRFSLGTESGASVVDFDGYIRKQADAYLHSNPEATFAEVKHRFFADQDGKATIQTISPRIFEAAAFQNTLVLHEGAYAGIIQPGVHFIAMKKDYSNENEVVGQMRDTALCQKMAQRTYEDLIQSRRYNYQTFVKRFDEILRKHCKPSPRANASRLLFYAANYVNNSCIIPRGGSFLKLPRPGDFIPSNSRLERAVTAGLSILASIDVVLMLLSLNERLRRQVIDALRRKPTSGNYSWRGLLRDLRILAILSFARHRNRDLGPAFKVHAEHDARAKCLSFRSVSATEAPLEPIASPTSRQDEAINILKGLTKENVESLQWDHGAIGDCFTLSIWPGRNFSIHINAEKTYAFKDLHALFEKCDGEEMAVLAAILRDPIQRSWRRYGLLLAELCGTIAASFVYEKPLAYWKKMIGRFLLHKAPITPPAPVSLPVDDPIRPAA